jgi:hypothetical protein
MKPRKRITLEPELEALAGDWAPEMRRIVAKKFRRWARELDVSAFIISQASSYRPVKKLRFVRLVKLKWN